MLSRRRTGTSSENSTVYSDLKKTSLKEIGMYHMMKESAVEKARERAVTKLKKAYPGSRLQIWRNVHRMIRRPILPAKDDRALRRSFTTSTLRNQESGSS